MAVRRIRTREELEGVVNEGRGFLYNDFGGRIPRNCPIHHVTCGQVPRMLAVKSGTLSVKKAWSESLEELLRWIADEDKVYAFCADASDPVTRAGAPTTPRSLAKRTVSSTQPQAGGTAEPNEGLPTLRRAERATEPEAQCVLDAVASVLKDYEAGRLDIRTEADLQGHLFAALLSRLEGVPVPLHANMSLGNPREKIDLVVGQGSISELKVEADYPGVSKPVVFPEDVWKDLRRLDRYCREGRVRSAFFLMLDEDGSHARRRETASLWTQVRRNDRTSHWLFLAFGTDKESR